MAKVRRQEIIDRMNRGGKFSIHGYLRSSIGGPSIIDGYINKNYLGGYDACHVGDVQRMLDKGELVRIPNERSNYTEYRLADHLVTKQEN